MFQRFGHLLIKVLSWIRNPYVVDEHFVPKLGLELEPYLAKNNRTAVHHLIRYQWASEVLAQESVSTLLDIACGEGYGGFMIAKRFPNIEVIGADYDSKAVQHAGRNYSLPNLSFRHGDVLNWNETVGSQVFGAILSFDTLEHVAHRELMLENLVAHLHPDGLLLLSTPCGHAKNVHKPRWPSHKIEYNAASLYDFLRRYFLSIQRPEDDHFPARNVFDQLEHSEIEYLMRMNPVICRNPIRIANPYHAL